MAKMALNAVVVDCEMPPPYDVAARPHEAAPGTVQAAGPSEATAKAEAETYRDVRATVTLGAGESQEVLIRCEFEPDRVLVDPDALVLQLQRKLAVHRF